MNQWVLKIKSVNFLWILLPISVWALEGCDDPGNVGIDLDEDEIDIIATDTLTINSSTVYIDSVDTQGAGTILSGSYTDEYLGRVTTKGYLVLSLSGVFSVEDDARYDSLQLRMDVAYHYGNADQPQQLSVHEVTEEIEPADDNDRIYNFDSFEYDPEVLGQTTFTPDEDDNIEIRMSDQLGQDLFDAAQNEDDIVTDTDDFQEYLKGLVLIESNGSGTAVSGFDADSTGDITLRLYYSEHNGEFSEDHYYDFPVVQQSSFSQVIGDRPPPLDQLAVPNDEISSVQTGNTVYLQSGMGLMTRLDFPTIDKLFDIAPDFLLSGAELYLFPVADTYKSTTTPLAEPLVVYVADVRNRILGNLTYSGTEIKAYPAIDEEFNRHTYYKINVTDFVREELYTDRHTGRGLLIAPTTTSYKNSVDRLIMGDDENADFKMYLQIVLAKINN